MSDYFDSVGDQLGDLCRHRAHRRRPAGLRRPTFSAAIAAASVAVTAAVVAAALGVFSGGGPPGGGGGPAPAAQTPTSHRPTSPAVRREQTLLSVTLQSGATLGRPGAPVTLTVFSDLQCPICRAFTLGPGFGELLRREVRSGALKVVFGSLCTATCAGPHRSVFDTQQAAAAAAGRQDLLWQYVVAFYGEQGREGTPYVTPTFLSRVAEQVPGLDLGRWQADRGRADLAARVLADAHVAAADHVLATPGLVFSGPAGRATAIGALGYPRMRAAVTAVRQRSGEGIVEDCIAHGHLSFAYSPGALRHALGSLSTAQRQYTNCARTLRDALHASG